MYNYYYEILRLWSIVILFKNHLLWLFVLLELYSLRLRGDFYYHKERKIQSSPLTRFSLEKYGNIEKQEKIAAVSRETPEGSRSSRGQTVLDPELTKDYISQVSEKIEGRVTKKLSKEFSKTESRILGALSKLDEFLLNPQVWTCSVAVQGTSRNANPENREIHGDRSLDDPYPEVGYFPHHSGQLNSRDRNHLAYGDRKLPSQLFNLCWTFLHS